MAASTVYRRGGAEFDRSLSFYDAIYAFALTLLIANVDAPEPEAWSSIGALMDSHLGGQLLGLLISFVVIVLFWLINQRVVSRMSSTHQRPGSANCLLCPQHCPGLAGPDRPAHRR